METAEMTTYLNDALLYNCIVYMIRFFSGLILRFVKLPEAE